MKFLVFFVFSCFLGLSACTERYKVENLESSSGLLVDFFTKMVFSATEEMQFGIYADFARYDDDIEVVTRSYQMLKDFCKIKECAPFGRTTFLYKDFMNKAYTLSRLLEKSSPDVPHTITGRPIDAKVADEMVKNIREFEADENAGGSKYALLYKAGVSKRNETVPKIERLKVLYEKHKELMETMDQNEEKIKNDADVGKSIDEHLYAVSLTCLDLNNEMNWLIESLYYVENKVLHPEIMDAEKFLQEMKKASTYLPETMKFPYPVLSENTHQLMHLMEFNTFYHRRTLVFVLTIPLVEDVVYNLYNLLPLPMETSEGKFVFVKPTTDNIAISEDLKQYAPMDILRYCTKIGKGMKMCKREQIYSVEHRPICETEIIIGKKKVPESCNTRIVANDLNVWHQLESETEWLFAKSQPEEVTIQCDDEEKVQVKVSKTGILTLDSDCTASTDSIKVGPGRSMENPSSVLSTSGDIAKDACCNAEAVSETLKGEDVFTQKLSNVNLYNMDSISHKLKSSQGNKV